MRNGADPTSLELFSRVVDRIPTLRVLLVMTYRPEFEPPWLGRPYVTTLTINRLAARDAGTMIDRIVGDKQFSASIRKDIIERTDGVPLFIEEMTRQFLEADTQSTAERTIAAVPSPRGSTGKPARLADGAPRPAWVGKGSSADRRGDWARFFACFASRSHTYSLRRNLIGTRPSHRGRFAFRQGTPPLRDLPVQTRTCSGRRLRHAAARAAPRAACPHRRNPREPLRRSSRDPPELLARQCSDAGLIEKAAGLWGKAGQRSLERSALIEAVALFARALEQFATLPATPALHREQIKLQVGLANALYHSQGVAAARQQRRSTKPA